MGRAFFPPETLFIFTVLVMSIPTLLIGALPTIWAALVIYAGRRAVAVLAAVALYGQLRFLDAGSAALGSSG